MGKFLLTEKIIELSDSKTWDRAKLEWELKEVYIDDELDICLCGHYPIKEICIIRNKINREEAIVGNVCVKKFLNLSSYKIFQSLKKIQKDNKKSLNAESLTHAYKKKWINTWDYDFSMDTIRKRNLSSKQLEKRVLINTKVLNNMKKR